jgi:hypothetical protein
MDIEARCVAAKNRCIARSPLIGGSPHASIADPRPPIVGDLPQPSSSSHFLRSGIVTLMHGLIRIFHESRHVPANLTGDVRSSLDRDSFQEETW